MIILIELKINLNFSEKDRKVLNEVCQEFLKVQNELKNLLNLESRRIDPKKEKVI